MENKKGSLFVLSAPSGAGKTTITQHVVRRLQPDHAISRVVTYTSRNPRREEKHGLDYHFVSEDEFREKIEQNFFVEWSQAYGAYYGSPVDELSKLAEGISLIMILDLTGAINVINQYNPTSIWLSPPDINILRDRLARRGPEADHRQDLRLKLAQDELSHEALALFNHKLVNIELEKSVKELEDIIRSTIRQS